jgi:hypothetical protein
MNTFIAYPDNLDFNRGIFHKSSDGYKKSYNYPNLDDFSSLTHKDKLIYLLPSSIISSYPFEKNNNFSNNLANFISDVDSYIVNDVSENEFFIYEDVGFVMDKELYKQLNTSLNKLVCEVILVPDYFLNRTVDANTITEFNNRFLFSFEDGTGSSTDIESLTQYLEIIKSQYINFKPNVFSSSQIKELEGYVHNKDASVEKFASSMLNNLPNLFKFEFSFKNIFNKLNFSKGELYVCLLLVTSLIALPYIFTAQNNKQIDIYETEIFNIFKMIDKNTNRVVTPKVQIDQLIEQIPGSSKIQPSRDESKFENYGFLISLGEKYIESVEIDFKLNQATLDLFELPQMQYTVVKNAVDTFNVKFIDENIVNENNKISGEIKIEIKDE